MSDGVRLSTTSVSQGEVSRFAALLEGIRGVSHLKWLQVGVTLLILVAVAILGRHPSVIPIIAVLGFVGLLVLIKIPPLGIMAVIIGGLAVPFAIGTGTESPIHMGVLLLAVLLVLWIFQMMVHHRIQLLPSPTRLPLLCLLVVTVLAFGVGQLSWFRADPAPMRAQFGGLAIFVLSAGAFWLVGHQVREIRWLSAITWFFLIIGAVYMTARLVPPLGGVILSIIPRQAQVESLLWVSLVALAGGQALFNRSLARKMRLALFGLVLVTLFVGWTQSRVWVSGWLPPLVVLVTLVWLRSRKLGVAVILIGLLFVVTTSQDLPTLLVDLKSYSIFTRQEARDILLSQMLPVDPLLGFGPANYYWYASLFPILGYHVVFNSHNQYVDLLLQTGILGTACYLWFFATVLLLGWRLRRLAPEGFAQAYVYGAFALAVGMLVAGMLGDWVIPFVYNIGLSGFRSSVLGWLFLGGLLVIEQMVRAEPVDA